MGSRADPASGRPVGWPGAAPPVALWPGGLPAGPMGSLLAAAGVWPNGPAAAGLGAGSWPGGVMPGGGRWQDWLAAAAALGFQADPGAWPDGVNTGAAASAASSEARIDDRPPSAPGATSAPVGAASARRRGGRAPRPPPPAPAPPLASEHIDLTDDRSDSSDIEMDDSDSSDNDEWTTRTVAFIRSVQNNLFATAIVASKYFMIYYDKKDARTPEQSGFGWTMEKLNGGESYDMFRMDETLFYKLHDLLVSNYGLKSSLHMHSIESLAIFLFVCGHGTSNSACYGIFKHSSETISRKFEEDLNCMVGMSRDYIRPIDPNFSRTHQRIRNDHRMMPYFRDCIGALDGTHISATPLPKDLIRYIGRSGKATQNVLAIVDFDMQFTYASIGQPGSMHDTNVLFHALRHDQDIFPHPPQEKYYLVDAGYPNRPGYLAPYRGERYHVPDWRTGLAPRGEQELFNHLHSSLRNVVERSFGVLKMKWRVLLKMPSYPMDKQKMIVAATMCLHNFIRENSDEDKDFRKCDRNPDYVPTIPKRYRRHHPSQNAGDTSTSETDDRNMDKFRDDLARAIFLARSS